jgi:DNA-binding transcriptional MocR family regulator
MTRYETLANTMAAEIRSGSIAVGSRMPSLRQVIAQHGVSQSNGVTRVLPARRMGSRPGSGTFGLLRRARRGNQQRDTASRSVASRNQQGRHQ